VTWYDSASPCTTTVPCGNGTHTLRWEAGRLQLLSHPDGEAEQVLSVLGGQKAGCVAIAEMWTRHVADLSVLTIWPRGPQDALTLTWETVADADVGASFMTRRLFRPDARQEHERATELRTLLMLGPAFGYRLTGHVTAAHAPRLAASDHPALTVATESRAAAAIAEWAGTDPARVRATLTSPGPAEVRDGGELELRLPADWLATVWACGLALVDGHLVVAVTEPGWPDAEVLALSAPSTTPVALAVRGTATGTGDPHWVIA
jgi:hypothetical protein